MISMDDLKIELRYDPEHFREIYYRQGQNNYFKYKPTRNAIIYFGITATLTFVVYIASFTRPDISWLMVLGVFILLITGIYAIVEITKNKK